MEFSTKFSIGDSISIISSREAWSIVNCLTCNRTGKVEIQGETFVCPACDGKSAKRQYAGHLWFVMERDARIGKIGAESVIDDCWTLSSHGYRPDEAFVAGIPKITYMVDKTGIGSGSVYDEDKCFGSTKEAQKTCDARNFGAPSDDDDAKMLGSNFF